MHYLDTSFLAPIFVREPTSTAIQAYIQQIPNDEIAISHWTRVEFGSLLGVKLRTGILDIAGARNIERQFEHLAATEFVTFLPTAADFELARDYVTNFQTSLRGGDALHLAIARNRNVDAIHTLDKTMLRAGQLLGLPVFSETR